MVEWKKLGEVMKIVRGASPRPITSYLTSDSNGVNWIKIGDVEPGAKYITRCIEKVTKEGAQKSRYLHSGDFVLSNSMSFGRPYILKIDGCIHDGWIAMSDFETHLSSGYLYEVLNSNRVQSYWKMKANNGGAMTNLNSDIVKDTIIPIPSLEEQTRIVGILDTFTSAIDNLKEQIAQRRKQYEYYRDQLLDLEGKPGVEMNKIAHLVKERIIAQTLTKENYTSVENLLKDKAGRKDAENVPSEGNWIKYQENDVLIGNIRPYLRKIWLSDREGGTNGDVIVVRTNDSYLSKYIYYCLSSERFFLYYNQALKDGKMPRGEKSRLLNYVIPNINKVEQQRIVGILDTFAASIANLEAQLEQRQKQYEYYRNKLLTFE